jgi:hypothetical protein
VRLDVLQNSPPHLFFYLIKKKALGGEAMLDGSSRTTHLLLLEKLPPITSLVWIDILGFLVFSCFHPLPIGKKRDENFL